MVPEGGLPSGTVTFLFTDVEGSTELLKRLGRDRYESVLAEQAGILRAAVSAYGGRVVDTQGDSLFCAFRSAREGVSAAIRAQRELALHAWPEQMRVLVRMGVHSGEPKAGDDRYVGIGVHRAARVGAAAHGGQILVSETARALVSDDLPPEVSLRDLGAHRLKDIDEPVRLYQVLATGLEDRFPPPKTLPRVRSRRVRTGVLVAALAVAGAGAAGALLATGSASARPVRLAANSIGVIDPKSGKPVGDVPLSFSPTDVEAGGDKVWVLNAPARTATSIDPTTLRVLETVGVHGNPTGQYAAGDTDWVGFPGGVDQIDSSGAVKVALWSVPAGYQDTCYTFVTGDGRTVWVSEGQDVAVIDAASGNVLRKLRLPAATGNPPGVTCYGLRYSGGHLLAIRNTDYSIGTVDLHSLSYTPVATDINIYTQTFGSGSWAAGFGYDWVSTWKTVSTSNIHQVALLKQLDPVSGQIDSQTVLGAATGPIAVDPASGIWVFAGKVQGTRLVRVDPRSGQMTHTIPLHHQQGGSNGVVDHAVAVGNGRLWVALGSP